MIDAEYSEIEKIKGWELFRRKFDKRFFVPLKIRRIYLVPTKDGYKVYYYKEFNEKSCLVPSRTNLTTKTGESDVLRSEGIRIETVNYILITDLKLLNGEGEKEYTDLVLIGKNWCKATIQQQYDIVIPHIEYSFEKIQKNIQMVEDEQI